MKLKNTLSTLKNGLALDAILGGPEERGIVINSYYLGNFTVTGPISVSIFRSGW
jgi:hypothetical protein